MGYLSILFGIIITVNTFWVFGFFIRLVGIETQKWSTTSSIFQIINLFPRTIGVFQVPLITLFTENSLKNDKVLNIYFYQSLIIFNLLGLIIGLALLPVFLWVLKEISNNISENASFRVLFKLQIWRKIKLQSSTLEYTPFFVGFKQFKFFKSSIFYNNLLVSFLICIALPACLLAGYHLSAYRATILSSVSIIYGVSSFITILLIDTRISVLSDMAFDGSIHLQKFKEFLFDCLKGRIVGIAIGALTLPYIYEIVITLLKYVLIG